MSNFPNGLKAPASALILTGMAAGLSGCDAITGADDPLKATQVVASGEPVGMTDSLANKLRVDGTVYSLVIGESATSDEFEKMKSLMPSTSGNEKRALSVAIAKYVIGANGAYGGPSVDTVDDVKKAMSGVDPNDTSLAIKGWSAKTISDELSSLKYDSRSYKDFVDELKEKGINSFDKKLNSAIQQEVGTDAIKDLYDTSFVDNITRKIDGINDPDVRSLFAQKSGAVTAKDIIDQLGFGYSTKEEASTKLNTIIDPKIKKLAAQAIASFSDADADTWRDQQNAKVESYELVVDTSVEKMSEQAEGVLDKMIGSDAQQKIEDGLTATLNKALDAISDSNASEVKTFNKSVKPHELSRIPVEKNPDAILRLTDISAAKDVLIDDGSEKPTMYKQLGEIFFNGKKTALEFDSETELDSDTRKLIQQAVDANMPLIEAAQSQGTLLSIRLIVNPDLVPSDYDFNPHYDGLAREIRMILPQNNSVSVDMFKSALTHELVHALVADAYYGRDKVSDDEITKMANACDAISLQAYREFSESMKYSIDKLDALIGIAAPEDKQVLQHMRELIETGKLADVMAKGVQNNRYAYSLDSACESANFFSVLQQSATDNDTYSSQAWSDLYDRLGDSKQFEEVFSIWDDAIRYFGLNNKLNESGYVQTDSSVKEYLGHTEDNGNELMASTVDAVINYPKELNKVYRDLPEQDRVGMRLTIQTSVGLLVKRFPSLKTYLLTSQKRILSLK